MKLYKVIAKDASFHSGMVRLTKDQARRRVHNLQEVEGGSSDERTSFEIIATIHFKYGEIFWFQGDVNKSKAVEVELVAETATVLDDMTLTQLKAYGKTLDGFTPGTAIRKKAALQLAIEKHLNDSQDSI